MRKVKNDLGISVLIRYLHLIIYSTYLPLNLYLLFGFKLLGAVNPKS